MTRTELVPQQHGGALRVGNPGNRGGPGRPRSALRERLRGSLDERVGVLEEIADEMAGKVKIAKLNVDEHQAIASKFQVSSIPTFILFKNGEASDRMMGAMPKGAFEQFITRNV